MQRNNKLVLKATIIEELKNITDVYTEICKTKNLFETHKPSPLQLVGLSGFLQSFYNGIERILKRIAREIDDCLPNGITYHTDLLNQMLLDIKGVRPPVLSQDVYKKLKLLLNFRHRFRHAYHWELRWIKVKELINETDNVMKGFKEDMDTFMAFIDKLAEKL